MFFFHAPHPMIPAAVGFVHITSHHITYLFSSLLLTLARSFRFCFFSRFFFLQLYQAPHTPIDARLEVDPPILLLLLLLPCHATTDPALINRVLVLVSFISTPSACIYKHAYRSRAKAGRAQVE